MDAMDVGTKLVALCNEGKNLEAIKTLYADDVVSVEACEMPGHEKEMSGLEAVTGKTEWWMENHEVHSSEVTGPFPHDDRFACVFKFDATSKCGPMAGQRMQMEEVGVFTVKNGKISREEFFYAMG